MVIRNQTKTANTELSITVKENLDTIIKSAESSPGVEKIIQMPQNNIEFTCDFDGIDTFSSYDFGNGVSQDTVYDTIFSQREVSGQSIISMTRSWDMPFKVGLFQYITTTNTQYLIVDDDVTSTTGLAEQLNNSLPKSIKKKIITQADTVSDEGFDRYVLIEFSNTPYQKTLPLRSKKLIVDVGGLNLDTYGSIKFSSESPTTTVGYVRTPALLGAIFSENSSFYNCNIKKAYWRLNVLYNLTKNRVDVLLNSFPSGTTDCGTIYQWVNSKLSDPQNLPNTKNEAQIQYSTYVDNLKRQNENLIRGNNCPLIY